VKLKQICKQRAEQNKTNGIQQLKANTKLVGGHAIKSGVVGKKTKKSRQSIHEVSSYEKDIS